MGAADLPGHAESLAWQVGLAGRAGLRQPCLRLHQLIQRHSFTCSASFFHFLEGMIIVTNAYLQYNCFIRIDSLETDSRGIRRDRKIPATPIMMMSTVRSLGTKLALNDAMQCDNAFISIKRVEKTSPIVPDARRQTDVCHSDCIRITFVPRGK